MSHRPECRNTRRLRRLSATVFACLVVVFAAACGTLGQGSEMASSGAANATPSASAPAPSATSPVASPSATTAPQAATPTATATTAIACQASQLALNLKPLGGGAGHTWDAWSLTNSSSRPCSVAGGLPGLEFDNAAGQALTTYRITPKGTVSTAPLTPQPGAKIWVFTDTTRGVCDYGKTVSGGPFSDVVIPPSTHVKVDYTNSGLDKSTLTGICPTLNVSESGLQTTEPTLQNEFGPRGTPVATP